ncbi:rhomboid family intramembrane serine protease [Bdellovibrio svalbardensis]|uniref:Rhomboid family intramembrane serine protease n=1 Tax=Bdellovibrio svalbardensis TaxID=2972972 RepID=A0ABT6DPM7_9BACT|nr:rhomboid family intramembrane serine protease [Bdellovibrio svalbardensis]MDG0817801.1 rhomboid family intramembrane serine protease [Bdellovibrio svalbardensis]
MILPSPADIRDYKRFPLTLTLVLLNVFIFILIFSGHHSSLSSSNLLQEDGLTLSGRLYYQYLKDVPAKTLYEKPEWTHNMRPENTEQMGVLGAYALRDADFLKVAETSTYRGDDIAIAAWKKDISTFRKQYQEQLLFRFGLSSLEKGPFSWLTYQFSHSNWIHLLSNLMFLVVIGAAVESLAGSGVLLLVYLIGGLAGGLGFLLSQGAGTVPMVGASASISALLAFYCVAEIRNRVRYFYFVSPMPGHNGFIYLPTFMIFPLFLLVDLANLWSTPEGLGSGVAYAAHLGGTVFGLIGGYAYRVGTKGVPVLTKY